MIFLLTEKYKNTICIIEESCTRIRSVSSFTSAFETDFHLIDDGYDVASAGRAAQTITLT